MRTSNDVYSAGPDSYALRAPKRAPALFHDLRHHLRVAHKYIFPPPPSPLTPRICFLSFLKTPVVWPQKAGRSCVRPECTSQTIDDSRLTLGVITSLKCAETASKMYSCVRRRAWLTYKYLFYPSGFLYIHYHYIFFV
jgi:hypothetical protein